MMMMIYAVLHICEKAEHVDNYYVENIDFYLLEKDLKCRSTKLNFV